MPRFAARRIGVYTSVGREWELLEVMRKFAHDAEDMVRNTPSAAELKKLYEREDARPPRDGSSSDRIPTVAPR